MNGTIIPSGTGISTNTSPSIPPISNALASDSSIPGSLFCGSSSLWIPSSSGTPLIITGITLSSGGEPSFINCTLYLYLLTNGTHTVKSFFLDINQTITSDSATDVWVSPPITVPTAYLLSTPSSLNTEYTPFVFTSVEFLTTGYFAIGNDGGSTIAVEIYPLTIGPITLTSIQGIYM